MCILGFGFFAGLNCFYQCQKVVQMKRNLKTYLLLKSCASKSSTSFQCGNWSLYLDFVNFLVYNV